MKKGIVAAVYLLIGILGIYRQFTMKTLTVEEAFSVLDQEKHIEPDEEKKDETLEEMEDAGIIYEYDMRDQPFPTEENEAEGEYYTESYVVNVYFSEDDKAMISSILPAEAIVKLNKQIQLYLDQSGYGEATELFVVDDNGLNGHQGFLFSASQYPENVFEVYWDGSELKFGEVVNQNKEEAEADDNEMPEL